MTCSGGEGSRGVVGVATSCLNFEDKADGISSRAIWCGVSWESEEVARAGRPEGHTRGLFWAGYL